MKKKLTNNRMLEVMKVIIFRDDNDIDTEIKFVLSIGMKSHGNITKIKNGSYSFTVDHLVNVCKRYNIDARFLLVENHYTMFTTDQPQSLMNAVITASNSLNNSLNNLAVNYDLRKKKELSISKLAAV